MQADTETVTPNQVVTEGDKKTLVLKSETAPVFEPLLAHARFKGAHGGRGSGKCLGHGTKVIMHDGSKRAVEDVRCGDSLLGIDGAPRKVLEVTSGVGDLYRIEQTTAIDYVVNADHLLALERSETSRREIGELSKAGNPRRPDGRYPWYGDDPSLIRADRFACASKRMQAHFFGYKRAAIFPQRILELDPYFLGLWLGDGDSIRPAITTADNEIVLFLFSFAQQNDLRVSQFGKENNLASGYLLARVNGSAQGNSITTKLRKLDVLDNKHIPVDYLCSSQQQRLALLAGILDADGYLHWGGYDIGLSNERLARQVKSLADSLAFKTAIRVRDTYCNGKKFKSWRVSISGDTWRVPCKIERKRVLRSDLSKNKDWRRTGIKAVAIGEGEYFGFELDGDHLFFLEDFTVTHNSHFFATLLVLECVLKPTRAVGLREIQNSIAQSSKLLIEDKIRQLGLAREFTIREKYIEAPRGGIITFQGMQNHTAESVRGLEGYRIAWFDEAHRASKFSLGLLRPTMRTPGSELWFSWNPRSPNDPVEQLLRGPDRSDDSIVVEANYDDNEWFPEELQKEMLYDKRRDPERYKHVWLGQYQSHSEARVFHNWKVEEFETDPEANFLLGADWGFATDPTVLIRCYAKDRTLFIDREVWKVGCEMDHTPKLFDDLVPDHPGWARKWKIVADSSNPQAISYMRRHGYPRVESAIKGKNSIEEGVEFLKSYDIVVHPRCQHVWDELMNYSYEVVKLTEEVLPKLADKKNHCVDSIRYSIEPLRRKPNPPMWGSW